MQLFSGFKIAVEITEGKRRFFIIVMDFALTKFFQKSVHNNIYLKEWLFKSAEQLNYNVPLKG